MQFVLYIYRIHIKYIIRINTSYYLLFSSQSYKGILGIKRYVRTYILLACLHAALQQVVVGKNGGEKKKKTIAIKMFSRVFFFFWFFFFVFCFYFLYIPPKKITMYADTGRVKKNNAHTHTYTPRSRLYVITSVCLLRIQTHVFDASARIRQHGDSSQRLAAGTSGPYVSIIYNNKMVLYNNNNNIYIQTYNRYGTWPVDKSVRILYEFTRGYGRQSATATRKRYELVLFY